MKAAWEFLIPYQDGELIAILPNCIGAGNSRKNNVYQVLSAIVYGLVDVMGVPANKIAVSDPSQLIMERAYHVERLVDNCRHKDDIQWDLYGSEMSSTEIPNMDSRVGTQNLSRLYDEADHIIQFPILSWHSSFITGALKGSMGMISGMNQCHNGDLGNGTVMADYNMPTKDRKRLIVADGLFGNTKGMNDSPHAFQTLGGDGGQHPSSALYFSRDIVAVDCVMYDDIRTEKGDKSGQVGHLQKAADADHGLGTFDMRTENSSGEYEEIDFKDINLT